MCGDQRRDTRQEEHGRLILRKQTHHTIDAILHATCAILNSATHVMHRISRVISEAPRRQSASLSSEMGNQMRSTARTA